MIKLNKEKLILYWRDFLKENGISIPYALDLTAIRTSWCPDGKQTLKSEREKRVKYRQILEDLLIGKYKKYENSDYMSQLSFKNLLKYAKEGNKNSLDIEVIIEWAQEHNLKVSKSDFKKLDEKALKNLIDVCEKFEKFDEKLYKILEKTKEIKMKKSSELKRMKELSKQILIPNEKMIETIKIFEETFIGPLSKEIINLEAIRRLMYKKLEELIIQVAIQSTADISELINIKMPNLDEIMPVINEYSEVNQKYEETKINIMKKRQVKIKLEKVQTHVIDELTELYNGFNIEHEKMAKNLENLENEYGETTHTSIFMTKLKISKDSNS